MAKMIRIQRLKEPKKNSGSELAQGQKMVIMGLEIKNTNKHKVYVGTWERKPWKSK